MSEHIASPSASQRGPLMSSAERVAQSSAEAAMATVSVAADPVIAVQLEDAVHPSQPSAADVEQKEKYGLVESPPPQMIRERSAAPTALAQNRTPIAITWRDVSVTVDLPAPLVPGEAATGPPPGHRFR